MKQSKIVQALINLEKASEERNIARNIGQDHAEWLELVYFRNHEFQILNKWFLKNPLAYYKGIELYFKLFDTSPFVYLNKN